MQTKKKLDELWIVRCLAAVLLFGQVLLHLLQGKTYYRKILQHMVTAGPASVSPVILVSGFAGMIFTIQTARELVRFWGARCCRRCFCFGFLQRISATFDS